MSKSAFASLSHTNRILEFDSASLRVPSPAANLGNNNNQRNYITVAVGIQERKLQNWDKLNLLRFIFIYSSGQNYFFKN